MNEFNNKGISELKDLIYVNTRKFKDDKKILFDVLVKIQMEILLKLAPSKDIVIEDLNNILKGDFAVYDDPFTNINEIILENIYDNNLDYNKELQRLAVFSFLKCQNEGILD